MRVVVATSNPHKLEEIRAVMGDSSLELVSLAACGCSAPPPEEIGETFEDNAAEKARYYARATGLPAIADDSGLVVDALDGEPGVHSSRWMGEDTPYPVKNLALLSRLEGLTETQRSARFVCVAAFAWPDGRVVTARGEHEGRISDVICGEGGFGYDPVFYSLEARETFGTLSEAQKNALSHRGRAMRALSPLITASVGP
ncbi:MAG: RdgB/HAM1 family non-canonical purine NTP pyrophosphatase [Proteobacteria bacterium]|nr:RdgB/HAM1 family non-canonical purine NTP pyrophosphatase [Pseudomonadota bacterium]